MIIKRLILLLTFLFSASTLMAGTIDYGVVDIISHSSLTYCRDDRIETPANCDSVAKRINDYLLTAGLGVRKTSFSNTVWDYVNEKTMGNGGFGGMGTMSIMNWCSTDCDDAADTTCFTDFSEGVPPACSGDCDEDSCVGTPNAVNATTVGEAQHTHYCDYYIRGCFENSNASAQTGAYGGYVITSLGVADLMSRCVGSGKYYANQAAAIQGVKDYLVYLKGQGKVVTFVCDYPFADDDTNLLVETLCPAIQSWSVTQGIFFIDVYDYINGSVGFENWIDESNDYINTDTFHLASNGAEVVATYIEQELVKILNVGTKMY